MKKINILFLVYFSIGFNTFYIFSQDIHFSQFYMAPLLQNPALAGANHDLQAIVNYKNQWGSVASPYKTGVFSFDMKLNSKKAKKGYLAAGINVLSDKAGDAQMGTTQANLSVAYHVILNDNNTLGGGLMGGIIQRSINYSNLMWTSQFTGTGATGFDNSMPTGEPTGANHLIRGDFGGGLLWSYNKGEEYM